MPDTVPVMIEVGPKRKRSVASAFDWPGWDRGARSEDGALSVLETYRPRYAKVAALAGLADDFGAAPDLSVVEHVEGLGMKIAIRRTRRHESAADQDGRPPRSSEVVLAWASGASS